MAKQDAAAAEKAALELKISGSEAEKSALEAKVTDVAAEKAADEVTCKLISDGLRCTVNVLSQLVSSLLVAPYLNERTAG